MLILYCLATQTFPQNSSSPKGGSSACWHVYPWTELLRKQSKFIYPSLQSVPTGLITKEGWSWKAIVSPSCVICSTSRYYLCFSQGMDLMGNNLGLKEMASSYPGTHLTRTAALSWHCSLQYDTNITENHQLPFTVNHSLYNMALSSHLLGKDTHSNMQFKLLQLKTIGCSKTS